MRSKLHAPLIACLAAVSLGAAGCGSDGIDRNTLLAQSKSEDLLTTVDRIETQLSEGDCSASASSVRTLRRKVDALPDRYDGQLVGNLKQWVDHLDERVSGDCTEAEPEETPTPEPSPPPEPTPTETPEPTPTETPEPEPTEAPDDDEPDALPQAPEPDTGDDGKPGGKRNGRGNGKNAQDGDGIAGALEAP